MFLKIPLKITAKSRVYGSEIGYIIMEPVSVGEHGEGVSPCRGKWREVPVTVMLISGVKESWFMTY